MTMDVIIDVHIVYLIKQKPNIKLEYYKNQQSECYYAHGYLQYMCTILTYNCTDWLTTVLTG